MSKPTLTITKDFTQDLNAIVKRFKKDQVLVGVPQSSAGRQGGAINNATLLAIHNFGSPANHIPARPVLEIGIRKAQDEIADQFAEAAKRVWDEGDGAVDRYYNRAGMIAANSIKKVINSQEGIAPPAESTLEARKARGFLGTKALIVTAQLRNSITYVLKRGG